MTLPSIVCPAVREPDVVSTGCFAEAEGVLAISEWLLTAELSV